MRIQTVVQYHESRAHLLPSLLASLPPGATVVTDPGGELPSPWRCYLRCLEALEPDADSLLIAQDDCLPCRDFTETLSRVARRYPSDPVALFVPGIGTLSRRVLDACAANKRYVELPSQNTFVPLVAVLWPRDTVEALLEYQAERPFLKPADDGNIGKWAEATKTRFLATVPSLVEHPDRERSLVGRLAMGGRNPGRVAACWVGEEMSPLELEW